MNSKRRNCAAFGTTTASLAAGSGPPDTSNTEEYDGTSWTEVNNMPTALNANMGAGIQTAGLSFGGAFHVGVECYGKEWSFGFRDDDESGIFSTIPRTAASL